MDKRIIAILFSSAMLSFSVLYVAHCQAESAGGVIGKRDKSIGGGEDLRGPAPKKNSGGPAVPARTHRSNTFDNPTINGIRVDRCMKWGPIDCGQPAADHWCRSKGFSRATSWTGETVHPTIFQGRDSEVKVCDFFFCGAFSQIVCE